MSIAPMRIGALSARTGRSIHTIRWYEAQGLIPGVVRDGGGRRVYADGHVGWLELMQALKLLDAKIDFYGRWQHTGKRPTLEPSNPAYSKRRKP